MNKDKNLVWLDLEMTGLNPQEHKILEIAVLITDSELNIIAQMPSLAIFQPQEELDKMDAWNKSHHGESGLIERVKNSDISEREAEIRVLEFMYPFVEPKKSPLCGNSISQDRRFLDLYMPELNNFFHYRNIDISSIKELATRWYPELEAFHKKNTHTALLDIQESVLELRYYRENLFKCRV